MFQFSGSLSIHLFIQCTVLQYCCSGFPHSDICGSIDICSSPQLFAACHVLLRLLMPRHSPYALYSLILSSQKTFCFSGALLRTSVLVWFSWIMWVSFCSVCVWYLMPIAFCYPFRYLKKPIFFLLFLFSIFKQHYWDLMSHGGDKESRTLDPLLARQVLSQLSYTPIFVVGWSGLEPPTSRLSGVRSNQLSYQPISQLTFKAVDILFRHFVMSEK